MLVRLVGEGTSLTSLLAVVDESLTDLGLVGVVRVETTNDATYQIELGITRLPALCIEEERIEYRDMIFEGMIPEKAEIMDMFRSIIGGDESITSSCHSGGCGTCGNDGCC